MTHTETVNTDLSVIEFEPIVKQSGLNKAEQYAAIFAPFMITLKQLSDKAAAELKASQEAAAKAQAELKAKEEAEAKLAAEKLAAEKKAAKAPVKEKLRIAVTSLELTLPESDVSADIMSKFIGFKTWALQQIETI